jgi:hypothetical protein
MRHSIALLMILLVCPLSAANACEGACIQQFPSDSGILNVRDFGAKGDGRSDDTAPLVAAIAAAGTDTRSFFWRTRVVYLPSGTYRVSRSLAKRYPDGRYGSGMILVGESETSTIIKLTDNAPGFGDPNAPRGVIMTTAKLLDGSPTSGGKDYTHKGEGNDAYENFVENLTVDVGTGNPGAVGIDYLANNIGAIRDVRVVATTGAGAIGIAMQRKWPGPALLQRVEVQGFDTGIAVANTEYGVTLEHVALRHQRLIGLANDGNSIAAADLTIDAPGTAIANTAPGGLVSLTNSTLRRASEGSEPVANNGTIVAHGVMLDGFAPPEGATLPLNGVWQGQQWQPKQSRVDLTLVDAPPPASDPVDRWLNVLHYAGTTKQPQDITEALRRAMATGASTIYLPYGRYIISDGIEIPPTVRRIVGMNSSLTVTPGRKPEFSRDTGMFRIDRPGQPLLIERLAFDMTDLGDQLAIGLSAKRDVTLRDIVTAGTSLIDRRGDGGRVFIEDVCCGSLHIAGSAAVFARQLDTEGGDTRILNEGSPLVILGLKTEGDCTVLDNRDGARSSILGGLLYIVGDADPKVPAFRNANAVLEATFVEEAFSAAKRYTVYLRDHDRRRDVDAANYPTRGYGRIVPWLMAGH